MTCPTASWWLSLLIAGAAGAGIGLGAVAARALLRAVGRD